MPLLIDENVPDSVTHFLRERGHDVHLVRDILLPGTPDYVIAFIVDEMCPQLWLPGTADTSRRWLPECPRAIASAFATLA